MSEMIQKLVSIGPLKMFRKINEIIDVLNQRGRMMICETCKKEYEKSTLRGDYLEDWGMRFCSPGCLQEAYDLNGKG